MQRTRLSSEECEALIERYSPLVKAIAQSLLRRLPPSVELDELMQEGYLGLMGGLFQATRMQAEGQYRSYLAQRVRGAMLDGLRAADHGSRRTRKRMREVEQAIHELRHGLGREPLESEVAAKLGIALADYQHLLQQAHEYRLLSLEDFAGDEGGSEAETERTSGFVEWCAATGSDPFAALQRRQVQRRLLQALSGLAENENAVLQGYYVEELTMREIGERLRLTEGRISQIHAQAIARLRADLFGADTSPSPLKPRKRTS